MWQILKLKTTRQEKYNKIVIFIEEMEISNESQTGKGKDIQKDDCNIFHLSSSSSSLSFVLFFSVNHQAELLEIQPREIGNIDYK